MEYVLVTNHRNFAKNSFFWRHVKAVFWERPAHERRGFWLQRAPIVSAAFHREHIAGYGKVMVDLTAQVLATGMTGRCVTSIRT